MSSYPTTRLIEGPYDEATRHILVRTPMGKPPKFLYRSMPKAEYERALSSGHLSGRPLHASGEPVFYTIEPGPDNVLVAIQYRDEDGWDAKWGNAGGDLYAVTYEAVPMSRVVLLAEGDKQTLRQWKTLKRVACRWCFQSK